MVKEKINRFASVKNIFTTFNNKKQIKSSLVIRKLLLW